MFTLIFCIFCEYKMKTVLVIGGIGKIGTGIIEELIKADYFLIVTSRSLEKLTNLKNNYSEFADRIDTYQIDMSNETEVINLYNYIDKKYKKINAIVNTLHYAFTGTKIKDIEVNDWENVLKDNLTSQLLIIKYLVKNLINDGNGYLIHLNCEANLKLLPMSIPMNIIAASLKIMYEALAIELVDENIRVVELLVGNVVTSNRKNLNLDSQIHQTPNDVGKTVLHYINGAKPRTTIIRLVNKIKQLN